MKYLLIVFSSFLFFSLSHGKDNFGKIDAYLKPYLEQDQFAGVVLIADDYKPLYHKAFGLAHILENRANTTTTRFDIGSINKDFTKVLIFKLVAEGKLNLDDKLDKYLAGFETSGANKATIQQILTHSAGFGDYTQNPDFFQNRRLYKSINDIIEAIQKEPLMFAPGQEQSYSNSGYVVLGAIIEKVSGKSYEQNLKQKILIPLQMNNTFYTNRDNLENRARGYMIEPDGSKMDTEQFQDYATPAGGAFSTTTDLLAFYKALLSTNTLLNDNLKSRFFSHSPDGPTRSWQELKNDPNAVIGFAGGHEGWNTLVNLDLFNNRIIIVMANYDEPIAEIIGGNISKLLRGEKAASVRLPKIQYVYKVLMNKSFSMSKDDYKNNMKMADYDSEDPFILNRIGYFLLQKQMIKQAIAVFKLNVALFPQEANPWDSLAEAYMLAGNKQEAIKNYQKALELDPGNQNAKKMIERMQSEK